MIWIWYQAHIFEQWIQRFLWFYLMLQSAQNHKLIFIAEIYWPCRADARCSNCLVSIYKYTNVIVIQPALRGEIKQKLLFGNRDHIAKTKYPDTSTENVFQAQLEGYEADSWMYEPHLPSNAHRITFWVVSEVIYIRKHLIRGFFIFLL